MIAPMGPRSIPSPGLDRRMAPPGSQVRTSPVDGVTLSRGVAEAPPEAGARKPWLGLGLLAAAAVAGTMGFMASQQATVEPPPAAGTSRTVEAPATLAMEAPAVAGLELTSMKLGTVPASRPFTGESLTLTPSSGVETKVVDGQTVKLEWRHTGLSDERTGDSWAAGDLTSALEAFTEGAKADWTAYAEMQPAGNTGRLASVVVREGATGEHGGNESLSLRTYDRDSGEQAFLRDLLGERDFRSLTDAVRIGLSGPGGQAYQSAELDEWVNNSFAVTQEGGRQVVRVAVPLNHPAAQGSVAEFTFQLGPGVDIASSR